MIFHLFSKKAKKKTNFYKRPRKQKLKKFQIWKYVHFPSSGFLSLCLGYSTLLADQLKLLEKFVFGRYLDWHAVRRDKNDALIVIVCHRVFLNQGKSHAPKFILKNRDLIFCWLIFFIAGQFFKKQERMLLFGLIACSCRPVSIPLLQSSNNFISHEIGETTRFESCLENFLWCLAHRLSIKPY